MSRRIPVLVIILIGWWLGLYGQIKADAEMRTAKFGDVTITTNLPDINVEFVKTRRLTPSKGALFFRITNTSDKAVILHDLYSIVKFEDKDGRNLSVDPNCHWEINKTYIGSRGTCKSYSFPAGETIDGGLVIAGLNDKITTKVDTIGSWVKVTETAPRQSIKVLELKPTINRPEGLTEYKIEVSDVVIPRYEKIERKGLPKGTHVVRNKTPMYDNNTQGTVRDTSSYYREKTENSCNPPEEVNSDNLNKGKTTKGNTDNPPREHGSQQNPPTPPPSESQPQKEKVAPKPTMPAVKKQADMRELKALIQYVLDYNMVSYLELRSDIHYTRELDNNGLDRYRYTALSLSAAEYDRFEGLIFRRMKPAPGKQTEIAQWYSSYPRKGCESGIIEIKDQRYYKGLMLGEHRGVTTYEFPTEEYTLDSIYRIGPHTFENMKAMLIAFSVKKAPTPFYIDYCKSLTYAKKEYNDNPPIPKTVTELMVLMVAYDDKREIWRPIILEVDDIKGKPLTIKQLATPKDFE